MRTEVILVAALVAGLGACSERDCATLSCTCAQAADCPASFGCAPDGLCYPAGQFPLQTFCSQDGECTSGDCQDGLLFCVARCGLAGNDPCADGTRCQGNECLPLHSLPIGETCAYSDLCPVDAECIADNCAYRCTAGYTTEECLDGATYCAVADEPSCVVPLPGCAPGGVNTCPAHPTYGPRICVDVGNDLGICRSPCLPDFSSGSYDDDCPPQIGSFPATCAPIGVAGATVCIEAAPSGGLTGPCNNGTQLCARGRVCYNGQCRPVCETQAHCASGTCTPTLNGVPVCL